MCIMELQRSPFCERKMQSDRTCLIVCFQITSRTLTSMTQLGASRFVPHHLRLFTGDSWGGTSWLLFLCILNPLPLQTSSSKGNLLLSQLPTSPRSLAGMSPADPATVPQPSRSRWHTSIPSSPGTASTKPCTSPVHPPGTARARTWPHAWERSTAARP